MCNNKLYKSEILRRKNDFKQIFASSKIMSSPCLTLRYLETPKRSMAFLVSRQVSSKAVTRNRIKRYCRETYRTNKDKFLANCTYIFIARENAAQAEHSQISRELLDLARKVSDKAYN
jgi:ribonuclease P protein component